MDIVTAITNSNVICTVSTDY